MSAPVSSLKMTVPFYENIMVPYDSEKPITSELCLCARLGNGMHSHSMFYNRAACLHTSVP